MTKRLYVGNLPYEATEEEVRNLFVQHGEVESVAMINDRDSGRFRGFCFVEMSDAGAAAAITALDGMDFGGRSLRVNEAKPREEGGRRSGGERRGGDRGDRGGGDRGYGERRGGDRGGDRGGGDRGYGERRGGGRDRDRRRDDDRW